MRFKEVTLVSLIGPEISRHELGQVPEDGKSYELVKGALLVSPSPKPKHQLVVLNCAEFLRKFKHQGYGEVYTAPLDVVLDDHNVVEPDVLFIRTERLHIVTDDNVVGAPDLVVEVVSPRTAARDRGIKAHLYAQFGVGEYWILDPESETLVSYQLKDGVYFEYGPYLKNDTYNSPLFPTIPVDVACFFP